MTGTTSWGGSDENRFRFLKDIVLEVRKEMPEDMPLLAKMNGDDHTPEEGVTPPLAAKHAVWLAELGIAGLEISGGTVPFSVWDVVRGDLPVDELAGAVSWWMRPMAKQMLKPERGKHDLEEGYNLEGAKAIRSAVADVPLFLVGGMRRVSHMEEVLESGQADFISICRPFIREPYLVKHIREGKTEVAACESCNKCAAAQMVGIPVRCYSITGFPQ